PSGGYISQPQETSVTAGGRAVYSFSIATAGTYGVSASVNAPNEGANSVFVNMDGEPTDPYMIWDIPITSGFQDRRLSWRGNGSFTTAEFPVMNFRLTAGPHQ